MLSTVGIHGHVQYRTNATAKAGAVSVAGGVQKTHARDVDANQRLAPSPSRPSGVSILAEHCARIVRRLLGAAHIVTGAISWLVT